MTVVLFGPWFSHIYTVCGIETHLLMATVSVFAHGHNWCSRKPLVCGKRRKELALFLAYKQNAICQLCISTDGHSGSWLWKVPSFTPASGGCTLRLWWRVPVWAVGSCGFLWALLLHSVGVLWELCPWLSHCGSLSAELEWGRCVNIINLDFWKAFENIQRT